MRHRRRRRRLGVKTQHRRALLRNLTRGLVLNRRIETTYERAKEAAKFSEKMVSLAKKGTLAARRHLTRRLGSAAIARLLMKEIAPRLKERQGGYTRVLRTGTRAGDGAMMALLEFSVPIERAEPKGKKAAKEKIKDKQPKVAPAREAARPEEKKETEKRGGFLSKLRKFLTGEEEK